MTQHTINDRLTLLQTGEADHEPSIPQLGFGVYKSPPDLCVQSCLKALELGYRHIDTAQFYENEAEVGEAVRRSGVPRADLFLTTKIMDPGDSLEHTYRKCVESVDKIDDGAHSEGGKGYVDLFLIHSAFAIDNKFGDAAAEKRREMWHALERLYNEGRAKSIGVSNFTSKHIEELQGHAQLWPPAVNQIELHPWCQQKQAVEWCRKHNIVIEAYCPIARNRKADDATVQKVADKHSVTPNQVLIRWSLQHGFVPLPKSDNPGRIAANADVYDFALDGSDMAALDGLDQGRDGAMVRSVEV